MFSPAAGLTANVAAMRTHQSLERFLPIQLTSKARISHTDRDTAVQLYTTKNCSNGKKVSFFIVNWISHLQREIVDSLNWRRLLQCLKLIGSTFLIKVKIYDFMLSASIHYICLQRFFFHTSLLCLDFKKKKYVYILFFTPLLRTFSLEYYRYLSNWVIPFFALMLCLLTYSLHYIMSFVGPFAD